jgi:tetratricopeptide (TPR) repeat protein
VVKSFEHLSDAQLEQYGTDRPTEISDDARRIDAHLEECAGCRARLLEHQRTNLDLVTRAGMNAAGQSDCASEDDLRKLAAGIAPADEALTITQHVAQCSHCAPILRAFSEEFSDDLTEDEIKSENDMLAKLKSSSAKWQKQMASQAMKANRRAGALNDRGKVPAIPGSGSTLSPAQAAGWLPRWIVAPAALAACVAIAFAVWFTQRDTPEKVEKLLAQAYTEHRTMEYRWPGAEWGPVRVTRGSGQSSLSRPTAQLEAEKILAEHQASAAIDPNWLTAKAEAELLDNQSHMAITDLTQALSTKPGSIDIELMLAIAYAQEGDRVGDSASRKKALELLNQVILQKTPPDPAALFNRALLYQRLNIPEKARADWDELLKTGDLRPWQDEARHKN